MRSVVRIGCAAVLAALLNWPVGVAWSGDKGVTPGEGTSSVSRGSVIEKLRAGGASVTALGERGGVSGWFVEPREGAGYSLYVTRDGYSVAGLLYGPEGELLTRDQVRRAGKGIGRSSEVAQAPVRDIPVGAKRAPAGLFERSVAAFGFTLGHSGPLVVVLGDPGCDFSRSTVEELGRKAVEGRFRLHVVPLGVLGGKSAEMAIRIASSPDPALAWFGRDVAPPHRAGGQWVDRNNAVFEAWGENAVPLIAWTSPAGVKVYTVGEIGDVERWASEVFGS